MAFVKHIEKKELSLPSLIDCVFLLLIFSIVTLPITKSKLETKQRGGKTLVSQLPLIRSKTTEKAGSKLTTLLFEIENEDPDDPASRKIIYVLKPNLLDSLSMEQARDNSIRDSLFAAYPHGFLDLTDRQFENLRCSKMIREQIALYKKDHFFKPSFSNAVEIRAVKNTEFRIVNDIMKQCSVYGDTIPRVVFKVLAGEE